jgi:hypothetical protein
MCDRKASAIADSSQRRVWRSYRLKWLRSTRHARRRAGIDVPLGGWLWRDHGVVQSGEQSLGVEGGRRPLAEIIGPRPSVHGLMRLET